MSRWKLGRELAVALLLVLVSWHPTAAQQCDLHGAVETLYAADRLPISAEVQVQGWAVEPQAPSGTGVSEVRLSLDVPPDQSSRVEAAAYGVETPAIAELYGSIRFARAGFLLVWDTSGITPGSHRLYIEARTTCGWTRLQARPVTFQAGAPDPSLPEDLRQLPATQQALDRGRARDWTGLRDAATEVLQHLPTSAWGYFMRGIAGEELRDYQGAIQDYDEALRLDPDHASAYAGRGFARHSLGDTEGARADYERAAALYQQQGNRAGYQRIQTALDLLP
ncbi:MAG TPA: tetratricopeptide repeat protein [Chloroflexota bacterium]|nr:tetratricopeptide repeat protein [Chloroflexota bacterium]